jgi:hypothetical protein
MKMKIAIGILILAAIVFLVWPALREGPGPMPNTLATSELAALRVANEAYRLEFGQFPTGTISQMCLTLGGQNPRQIVFVEFPTDRIQPDGAFRDPWGSPYQMVFPTPSNVVARSAGKDKTWGTGDDIERK